MAFPRRRRAQPGMPPATEVTALSDNDSTPAPVIDMHCHVGVLGDEHPEWGAMQPWFRAELVYRVMLLFVDLEPGEVADTGLRTETEALLDGANEVDQVVCLALDPVHDDAGQPQKEQSPSWVSNDYVLLLRQGREDKVLFGASVHPYCLTFDDRVREVVDQGAVLLKWLPSAQQFDLADERVGRALHFLATAKDGGPLPLLLHAGPEYALESYDRRTSSYDFLCWSRWDGLRNRLRIRRWHRPRLRRVHENLRAALDEGAVIIFAHCGLPYYAPNWLAQALEHSDLDPVRQYLADYPANGSAGGRCYADVSAFATPFRRGYSERIGQLPAESLLFGSDWATPVFELWRDGQEREENMRAVLRGEVERIAVPDGNLLDVNYVQLEHFFPGDAIFGNFGGMV